MQSSVHVTASGPALSLLMYENTKTPAHQMGFLLGAVVNQVTDTISDSQMRGEKTETTINISSILPIPMSDFLSDGSGRINKEKLTAIVKSEKNQRLKSQVHDIVGWYCFYRNSLYAMSMRQRTIHLQLSKLANKFSQDSAPDLFVLCLLQNNLTSKATHVFKHSFMRYLSDKNAFDLIPLQIYNLGMAQSSPYQNMACAPSRAALLKMIFDRISPDKKGKDHMLEVQAELQLLLNERVCHLSKLEHSRMKLENDLEQLQEQLRTLQKEQWIKRISSSGSNSNTFNECSNENGKLNNNRINTTNAERESDDSSDCLSPVLGSTRRSRPSQLPSQEY